MNIARWIKKNISKGKKNHFKRNKNGWPSHWVYCQTYVATVGTYQKQVTILIFIQRFFQFDRFQFFFCIIALYVLLISHRQCKCMQRRRRKKKLTYKDQANKLKTTTRKKYGLCSSSVSIENLLAFKVVCNALLNYFDFFSCILHHTLTNTLLLPIVFRLVILKRKGSKAHTTLRHMRCKMKNLLYYIKYELYTVFDFVLLLFVQSHLRCSCISHRHFLCEYTVIRCVYVLYATF